MSRASCLILFLIPAVSAVAGPAFPGRQLFAFDADSLRATLTLIGGRGPEAKDSLAEAGWKAACGRSNDTLPVGSGAWYEIALVDKRAGAELRFPVDESALRKGLADACGEPGRAAPERIAAGLKALAASMQVRMLDMESGPGK